MDPGARFELPLSADPTAGVHTVPHLTHLLVSLGVLLGSQQLPRRTQSIPAPERINQLSLLKVEIGLRQRTALMPLLTSRLGKTGTAPQSCVGSPNFDSVWAPTPHAEASLLHQCCTPFFDASFQQFKRLDSGSQNVLCFCAFLFSNWQTQTGWNKSKTAANTVCSSAGKGKITFWCNLGGVTDSKTVQHGDTVG